MRANGGQGIGMTELEFFKQRLKAARAAEDEAHAHGIQCEKDLKLAVAGRLTPRMRQAYDNWRRMQPKSKV